MKSFAYALLIAALVASVGIAADINVSPANSSYLTFPAKATAVTNGQAISVDNTFLDLTTAGACTTVTNTLAAPAHAGLLAVLQLDADATNGCIIKSDAVGLLPGNATLAAGGAPLVVISSGTNYWYEFISPEGTNLTAGYTLPALDGAAVTNLNGTNIKSGTVADARLGGYTTNTFLIYGVAAGTADCITNRIVVTNGLTKLVKYSL